MLTRFPGTCTCGCARPFPIGADIVRGPSGWILSSCAARPVPRSTSADWAASMAEVREILARARVVAQRAAAEAARGSTLPPGLAGGSRPAVVGCRAGSFPSR